MKKSQFKELVIESYNKSKGNNLVGLVYGAVFTCGFHDILDIKEFVEISNPDMLHLKSKFTDVETDIYEWELENFKIKNSENTIYVKLKNKPEIAFMF